MPAPERGRERQAPLSAGSGRLAVPLAMGCCGAALLFLVVLVATRSLVLATLSASAVLVLAVSVMSPYVALVVLACTEVSQVGSVLVQRGLPSPLVLTQLLALLALMYDLVVRRRKTFVWSPVLLGALVYIATRAFSILNALDPQIAEKTVISDLKDLLTLLLVLALLYATRRTGDIVKSCVAVVAGLAALTIFHQFILHNATDLAGVDFVQRTTDVGSVTFRHTGPVRDPNFWGRVLVLFLPFSFALVLTSRRTWARAGWVASVVLLILGVFLTQSRGAFLATAVAAVAFLAFAGWRYARWLAVAPLFVLVLAVLPVIGPRISTLGQLSQTSAGTGDLSLVLRVASQRAGLAMFEQHPIAGVGAGNYEPVSLRFTQDLPYATSEELNQPLAPHNAFLEFAAEGGVIGLAGFLFLLATMLYCATRAWLVYARRDPPQVSSDGRLLAAACVAALVGWVVASVPLHMRQFRTLLVIAAVAAAMDVLSRDMSTRRVAAARAPDQRRLALIAVAAMVLAALAVPLLRSVQLQNATTWRATSVAVMDVRPEVDADTRAYRFDVLGRTAMPTFARIAGSPAVLDRAMKRAGLDVRRRDIRLQVSAAPRTTTLDFVLTGKSRGDVVRVAAQIGRVAEESVARMQTAYLLNASSVADGYTASPVHPPLLPVALPVTAVWVVSELGLLWLYLERRYRATVRSSRGVRRGLLPAFGGGLGD